MIAARLRAIVGGRDLEERPLPVKVLAARAGLSRVHVHRILGGDMCSAEALRRLALASARSADHLLGLTACGWCGRTIREEATKCDWCGRARDARA